MSTEKFPEPATVYGLYSTRDNRVRYVGQTTGLPEWRMGRHRADARAGKTSAVAVWMRKEIEAGFDVAMQVIVEAGTLNETEILVIAAMRAEGRDLLNVNAGGRCKAGDRTNKPVSDETRRKISAAHKGKAVSAEVRARMSESKRASVARQARAAGVSPMIADNQNVGFVRVRWRGLTSARD